MSFLRRELVQRLLGAALGLVFIYASHDKIWRREIGPLTPGAAPAVTGPAAFARVVYRYQVVGPDASWPPLAANLVAVTLPWVELLAGLLLLCGVWRREAALVVALLLAVFVAAVGSAVARGIDLENCGCFSLAGEGRRAGALLIASDLGLLAAAALLAFVRPQPPPGPPAGPAR